MSVWNLIASSHFALEEDSASRETVINVAIGSTYSTSDSEGDSSEDEITNFHDHLASSPHQSSIHHAPECQHPNPNSKSSGSNNFLQVPVRMCFASFTNFLRKGRCFGGNMGFWARIHLQWYRGGLDKTWATFGKTGVWTLHWSGSCIGVEKKRSL